MRHARAGARGRTGDDLKKAQIKVGGVFFFSFFKKLSSESHACPFLIAFSWSSHCQEQVCQEQQRMQACPH